MPEKIVLVDENDKEQGFEEKLKVHQEGKLHRAFSIFVLNSKGQLLLQQRNINKYHSGGLWANSCCSHPREGENINEAIHRRLIEEMGFDCQLKKLFKFIYKTTFANGLTEYELDHVFVGNFNGQIKPNPKEASAIKWIKLAELKKEIKKNPQQYAFWLKTCYNQFLKHLNKSHAKN